MARLYVRFGTKGPWVPTRHLGHHHRLCYNPNSVLTRCNDQV